MKLNIKILLYLSVTALLFFYGCSTSKYVPKGKKLLKQVNIESDIATFKSGEMREYIQQQPNTFILGVYPLKLHLYNLSGKDTTKWINKILRKNGEAPVIYDPVKTLKSINQLEIELQDKGYFNAIVTADTTLNTKKQIIITYKTHSGKPYHINHYEIDLPDSSVMNIIKNDTSGTIRKGQPYNVDKLSDERNRITQLIRDNGYYYFQKELLYFTADSSLRSHQINIKLALQPQFAKNDSTIKKIFLKKKIKTITIAALPGSNANIHEIDTIIYQGYNIVYDPSHILFRPNAILNKIYIVPGQTFNEKSIDNTYKALSNLEALKYVNITFTEASNSDLNCLIWMTSDKPYSISTEVQGTNSGGSLGAGAGITYQDKNFFKGSETFKIGVNGSYEAIGGIGDNLFNSTEIGGNVSIKVPTLLLPLVSTDFNREYKGNTQFSINTNFQQRPQYQRNIFNAGIKYIWTANKIHYTFDLLDISYIYLPWISTEFADKYLGSSSSVRFSYQDNFIMRMGLGLSYTNKKENSPGNYFTLWTSAKTAGNLLYGLSHLFNQKKNDDGSYEIFHTAYSQYVKGDFDFSYNMYVNDNTRFVLHTDFGIGIPYGNSTILPFEERYSSGGANSTRGWRLRMLGPGSYYNSNDYIDFMNQSGDIKMDLNMETRIKLFWRLEGAAFVDAGNVWTIKNYDEQEGGVFKWDTFYNQIGLDYGFGLRFDLTMFLLRLDLGVKLYDPSYENVNERWRTENLTWRNDFALQFAIGYPF